MITRLQCENLSISINQRLLVNKLNLDIQSGSYIFILGNNGVGKTLTLHTLAGLLKDFSGEIIVCEEKTSI